MRNATEQGGWTALILAALQGHTTMAEKLIQAKPNVNHANNNRGGTALHWAAYNGHDAVADLLLKANANPTAVDNDGHTPAQSAEQCGHHELAQRLRQAAGSAAEN